MFRTYLVNVLLITICKLNVTRFPYTGGLLAILSSEKNFKNPKTGNYVDNYLKSVEKVPTD